MFRKKYVKTSTLLVMFLLLSGLILNLSTLTQTKAAEVTTLLTADFNSNGNGFSYQDDPFNTSQPDYASGVRTSTGGYGGSGGLQVNLGGDDSSTINGMSGAWATSLALAAPETGLALSFRYRIEQSATYEYDEYSQVLLTFNGTQFGRGNKDYVDQISGDGSSSQGNSSSYLPTSEWQQVDIFLGDYPAGSYDLVIGAYNNQKDASDETTTLVIDDVLVTSGNPIPATSSAQLLVDRLNIGQFKAYNQGVANFNDRCRLSGCSSTDYYNALAWVESELQSLGYTTVRHEFNYNGNTGTNLWATKIGSTTPTEMYMISTHLDGRGGGDAYDDDGSGVALVMEAARVFAGSDVTTDKSVRFLFWDKEEAGLYGSYGYVQDRLPLQGTLEEPTWLGLVTHDMILYDHGAGSPGAEQSIYADLDVEWRAGTSQAAASKDLAITWRFMNGDFSTDYPANAYNYSTNTDDTPFHPYVASVSVRENRRSLTSGSNAEWINPNYHTTNDIEASYSDEDTLLGFNAVQATVGTIAELAGVQVQVPNSPPVANPQSVSSLEDTAVAITLTGTDADNDFLSFQVLSYPLHGSLSGYTPNLVYTPNPEFSGADSFTFKANDGTVDSAPATVNITVQPVNDPPVALDLTPSTTQDSPVAITLIASDIEGDPLSYSVVSNPINGTIIGIPPDLTYKPNPGFSGTDSFSYLVNDGTSDSNLAGVNITVNPATLVFFDNFETDLGWMRDPGETDTATGGLWERADPGGTDFQGPKQLDVTVSGDYDLVTGRLGGSNANRDDIDGGTTSIRSPLISLPSGVDLNLSLYYYLAHARNGSPDDLLRISVIGGSTATLLEVRGANANRDAAWQGFNASLNDFAGQAVYILVEAADSARASLVEAAIDDLRISSTTPSSPALSWNFDSGVDGFVYRDDTFRGTSQPYYASGSYQPSGGYSGGGLQVKLGGLDTLIINGISGGWQQSFSLAAPSEGTLSFWYNLSQSPDYESDEYSQVMVSLDGITYGLTPNDYVDQVTGDGNGGMEPTTGWTYFQVSLGQLSAGEHTLVIGGYNNKKTYTNEFTTILIDEISLSIK